MADTENAENRIRQKEKGTKDLKNSTTYFTAPIPGLQQFISPH